MKKVIELLFLSLVLAITAFGQNIEKSYTSSVRGDEAVYFIYPMKKFKSKDADKELEYDVTYNNLSDSVTYNFTFYYKQPVSISSVSMISGDQTFIVPAKALFVEPKKKQWIHRVSARIAYNDFRTLYSSARPYQLKIESVSNDVLFEINPKDWKKQSTIINGIIQVIELNRKN